MFNNFLGEILKLDKKDKNGIYGRVWFSMNVFQTFLVLAIASHLVMSKTGGIAPIPLDFSKKFTQGLVYHSPLSEIPRDIPEEANSTMPTRIHIYGKVVLFIILVIIISQQIINESIAQYLGLDLIKYIDVFQGLMKLDSAGKDILQNLMRNKKFSSGLKSANRLMMKHYLLVFLVHIILNISMLILLEFHGVLYHFHLKPLNPRLYFIFEDPEFQSRHIMQVVLVEYFLNNLLFAILYWAAICKIILALFSFTLFFAGEFWRKSTFSKKSKGEKVEIPGFVRLLIINEVDRSTSLL